MGIQGFNEYLDDPIDPPPEQGVTLEEPNNPSVLSILKELIDFGFGSSERLDDVEPLEDVGPTDHMGPIIDMDPLVIPPKPPYNPPNVVTYGLHGEQASSLLPSWNDSKQRAPPWTITARNNQSPAMRSSDRHGERLRDLLTWLPKLVTNDYSKELVIGNESHLDFASSTRDSAMENIDLSFEHSINEGNVNHDLESSIDSTISRIDHRFIVTLGLVWVTIPTPKFYQRQVVMPFHHVRTDFHIDDDKHPIDILRTIQGHRQVWLLVYDLPSWTGHSTTPAWTSLHPAWGVTEFYEERDS